jgi:hypothetical protein
VMITSGMMITSRDRMRSDMVAGRFARATPLSSQTGPTRAAAVTVRETL